MAHVNHRRVAEGKQGNRRTVTKVTGVQDVRGKSYDLRRAGTRYSVIAKAMVEHK